MFTGLVEGSGKIKELSRFGEDMSLTISPLFEMADLRIGDSVSVDGVCLTVTRVNRARWGNKFRLIAAIHYKRKKLYIRHILTHEEYDRNTWRT